MHVSASILACNILELKNILPELAKAGVDSIHFDVMDGVYVDAITFGGQICAEISRYCNLPIYVHLMTCAPDRQVQQFLNCQNVKGICFHPIDLQSTYDTIKQLQVGNIQSGIAIANQKEFDIFAHIFDKIDFVTLMTVTPGKCGQSFNEKMAEKGALIRKIVGNEKMLFVDGGINCNTSEICVKYGANACVVGSYLFGDKTANALDFERKVGCLKLKYDG